MVKELKLINDDKVFMKWSIPAALLEEQTRTSLNKEIDRPDAQCDECAKCNKHTVKTGDNLQANSTVVEANKTMQKKEDLVKCMETLDDSLMILGERIGKKKSNSKENLTQKNMTSTSSYDFDSKDPISTIMSPKAERYVRRWLTDASPLERTTALELIDKLYREANEQDQLTDTQFQDVMKRVKNINWDQNKTSHPVFSRSDGSTHFKYLDLLSQQERRNHWMYCSWHHLPPYKISSTAKYDYPGSHYLHLLERQPKEYVIHPDLG